jgi:hypothetical protein
MTKFARSGKLDHPVFYSGIFDIGKFKGESRTGPKFEDSRHFKAWKVTKKHQGTKRKKLQAKSRRLQDIGVSGFSRTDRIQVEFEI